MNIQTPGVKKKGISTLQLRRRDNIILAIYHYLTVKVLHNAVLFLNSELKTNFFGSPYIYLYIKTIKYIPYQAYKFGLLHHHYLKVLSITDHYHFDWFDCISNILRFVHIRRKFNITSISVILIVLYQVRHIILYIAINHCGIYTWYVTYWNK